MIEPPGTDFVERILTRAAERFEETVLSWHTPNETIMNFAEALQATYDEMAPLYADRVALIPILQRKNILPPERFETSTTVASWDEFMADAVDSALWHELARRRPDLAAKNAEI